MPGAWGELGFTEPPAKEYVEGLVDLARICGLARRRAFFERLLGKQPEQILIRDFCPPEFWQMVESAGCIETASREIGPSNVIIYLNRNEELEPDHPISTMSDTGLARVRRLVVDLPYGFRVLEKGPDSIITLIKPNPEDERFPLMSHPDYKLVGVALNQIKKDLSVGCTSWHQ